MKNLSLIIKDREIYEDYVSNEVFEHNNTDNNVLKETEKGNPKCKLDFKREVYDDSGIALLKQNGNVKLITVYEKY